MLRQRRLQSGVPKTEGGTYLRYPLSYRDIEELRQALLAFRETYNTTWLVERHGFLTPAQFRQRQLQTAAIAA